MNAPVGCAACLGDSVEASHLRSDGPEHFWRVRCLDALCGVDQEVSTWDGIDGAPVERPREADA